MRIAPPALVTLATRPLAAPDSVYSVLTGDTGPAVMAIGIAGSTGFIGSYLSRRVASKGCGSLRLLARNTADFHGPEQAEIFHGDLLSRSDCERFAESLTLIYYLAHKNTPLDSDLDLPSDALVNLVPLLNLLDAIRRLETKPHLVYFSSGGAVYERAKDFVPYRETDRCSPISSYGIQKLAAEQYLRLASEKGFLTATVLRVGNAYGTLLSQYRMQGLIGVALNSVVHDKPIRLFGNPENVRDYIHLEDISDAAMHASIPKQPFTVFNVGTGVGHSVLDVLRVIEECHGRPVKFQTDPRIGSALTDWVVLNNEKAKAELGWCPKVDLDSGIREMLNSQAI
ncbi:MAG TPA: NAD-dependent epimerase/dehydratase family protein [Bryobacteraceae bacterium]|nr:NAD-dependent epimerase/dehydratase family protein [Bryobacteraceae bacterium]